MDSFHGVDHISRHISYLVAWDDTEGERDAVQWTSEEEDQTLLTLFSLVLDVVAETAPTNVTSDSYVPVATVLLYSHIISDTSWFGLRGLWIALQMSRYSWYCETFIAYVCDTSVRMSKRFFDIATNCGGIVDSRRLLLFAQVSPPILRQPETTTKKPRLHLEDLIFVDRRSRLHCNEEFEDTFINN
jgi:hypothetical protein